MSKYNISVCVPIYNVEKYISRCAESLFSQSLTQGVEFIFVNDATPDNSIEVLKAVIDSHPDIKPHVSILHHAENQGPDVARRTAVEAAQGDYIAHVDSDDWVEPDYLKDMFCAAQKEDADIVISGARLIYPKGKVIIRKAKNDEALSRLEKCGLSPHDALVCALSIEKLPQAMWAKLIRRSIYVAHPDCFTPNGISLCEDTYSNTRAFYYAQKIVFIDVNNYNYFKDNDTSITFKGYSEHIVTQEIFVLEENRKFLSEKYNDIVLEEYDKHIIYCKASIMLFCGNMAIRKKYADLYHDKESLYINTLHGGFRLMATLVRHHLWPLIWLYQQYINILVFIKQKR